MPSWLLLAGSVLVGVGALLPVAHTFDASALGSAHAAAWVVVLPALVALLAGRRRPMLGLAVSAGAGLVALGRLVADIGVLTDPNAAIRPDLFYELTTRAQPFTAAAGAGVLVAGDVLLVGAGVLAARALADRLALGAAPIFDVPADPVVTGQGPELLARAWEAEVVPPVADAAGPDVPGSGRKASPAVAGTGPVDDAGPAARNNGLIVAGFVGVLALLAGSLGLPYSGGYLTGRYLPAELGLSGIGSALAVALVATVAVLVAAVLPRRLAAALLGGIALGAAVPLLTAVLVRLAGAPVQLTASVPVAMAGAAVLAAAGLLGNAAPLADDYDVPSSSALRRNRWIGAALSLLTGVAGLAAWRLPQLHYNGGADPVLLGGYAISAPLAAPFLLAGLLPIAAAILWSVPAVGTAGRAMAAVAWLPLVFAATQTLYLLGQLVSSASVPNAGFAAPRWTAGPGLWWAVGALVLGLAAAVVAVLAGRQVRDASTLMPQEESLSRSRAVGARVAAALAVVTVVTLALPVYRTTGGSSATLLVGFDVRSWGVLALAAGMIAAAVAGGRALRPVGAVGFLLAGAVISAVRLVVPASVRAADGFSLGPGWIGGWVTAALFVLAAVLLTLTTRRIVLDDALETGGPTLRKRSHSGAREGGRGTRSRAGVPGAGKQRPVGKQASAGASSSKAKGRAS